MRIGLALATYNRLDYLKQCIDALNRNEWGGAYDCVVCDDGSTQEGYKEYLKQLKQMGITVLTSEKNKGVANNKNKGLKYLMDKGCTDIFLMEDDILMLNPKTCLYYIQYAKGCGIQHLNFGLHGPENRDKDGKPITIMMVGILCRPACVGAFSYYTRESIEKIGYMDEDLFNAMEHTYWTYFAAKEGLTTPFWTFADYPKAELLLMEIPGSLEGSVIRNENNMTENMIRAEAVARSKYGFWILDELKQMKGEK